jgi:hypothetical protein
MTVSFDNIANTVSDYFLVIYVNGSSEPSAYVPGQVPPNGMNSGTISFQVD